MNGTTHQMTIGITIGNYHFPFFSISAHFRLPAQPIILFFSICFFFLSSFLFYWCSATISFLWNDFLLTFWHPPKYTLNCDVVGIFLFAINIESVVRWRRRHRSTLVYPLQWMSKCRYCHAHTHSNCIIWYAFSKINKNIGLSKFANRIQTFVIQITDSHSKYMLLMHWINLNSIWRMQRPSFPFKVLTLSIFNIVQSTILLMCFGGNDIYIDKKFLYATHRTTHWRAHTFGHHKSLEWNVCSVELKVCPCECAFVQATIYSSFVIFVSSRHTVYEDDLRANKNCAVDGRWCVCVRECNSLNCNLKWNKLVGKLIYHFHLLLRLRIVPLIFDYFIWRIRHTL